MPPRKETKLVSLLLLLLLLNLLLSLQFFRLPLRLGRLLIGKFVSFTLLFRRLVLDFQRRRACGPARRGRR